MKSLFQTAHQDMAAESKLFPAVMITRLMSLEIEWRKARMKH